MSQPTVDQDWSTVRSDFYALTDGITHIIEGADAGQLRSMLARLDVSVEARMLLDGSASPELFGPWPTDHAAELLAGWYTPKHAAVAA